jgi:hypothetical protein
MTAEERFARNLSALTDHQVRHAEEIEDLREIQKGIAASVARLVEEQRITDKKLRALIATVARWFGGQSNN